jgi:hypothetical protein
MCLLDGSGNGEGNFRDEPMQKNLTAQEFRTLMSIVTLIS